MIKRLLRRQIVARLKDYPAVALLGARQTGKTTLARTFSEHYYDLESDADKLRLDVQWENVVKRKSVTILDEAQNYPELFPRIRGAIDAERKRNGRFLLLGSVSPALMKTISESLAGRIAICELDPLAAVELKPKDYDSLWLMGGYPDGGILNKGSFPRWQTNYLDLLAMRDLPLWGLPAQPNLIKQFFRMLAASHGQIWNASQIGKSLGISYHTASTYFDYLQNAFLVRKIQPYHANITKRLVKSPKIYWRDSGLLHSFFPVTGIDELLTQPWVGTSWEGWIIEQILIFCNINDFIIDGPYFFRTSDGQEIDLLFGHKGAFFAIEIKLTSYPALADMKKLQEAAELVRADKIILISRTEKTVGNNKIISTNLNGFFKTLLQEKG